MRAADWVRRLLRTSPRAGAESELGHAARAFVAERLSRLAAPVEPPAAGGDVAARIFSALMSKRFRKYSVKPERQAAIRAAIARCVERGAPIKLCLPFGGYKLWRFAEAPEADWAELFAIMHYARWLSPVALAYPPGIDFTFASDDIVVERINNIAKAETAAYAASFTALLDFVAGFAPKNLVFSLVTVGSLYAAAEFEAELAAAVAAFTARNGGALPALGDWAKKGIDMNVRVRAEQADDPQWREKVHVVHQAYYEIPARRAYLADPERILVFPARLDTENCIPIGSTRASVAKFWVGVGALEKRKDSFVERVLSPAQAAAAQFDWAPVSIDGLSGRNFRRLRILREEQP